MKKLFLLFVIPVLAAGYAAADMQLTAGKAATLDVEATTTFGWDINNNSTGLETKAGMELVFPLFPANNIGVYPEDTASPAVRLVLNNASFSWWNTFFVTGGNYEQDHFNKWSARPLVLTFDDFLADLVWKNYFFRIASTTTVMRTNVIALRSIFDDVMDAGDRFYYKQSQTRALWYKERYNIQEFPLLKNRINRDMLDVDYREDISGILAGGAEFERFAFTLKTASRYHARSNTAASNIENAWLFGADAEAVPIDNLKIGFTGFAGVNYDKVTTSEDNNGKNPLNFGLVAEYQYPLNDQMILVPFTGFELNYDTAAEDTAWEFGIGTMLYTRGFDSRESSRVLDYAKVIPVGASFAMSVNHNSRLDMMFSWFDPAGRDSLIENFGGFFQFELGNILSVENDVLDYALLAQLEYNIDGKFIPYVRAGYGPQFTGTGIKVKDTAIIRAAFGCYLTLIHFFSLDVRYEMRNVITTSDIEMENGLFSAAFTIRM
ncbi:MAG: hypothetical protein LBC52_01630 [Treponema sp.]|nr:hypothetical protein [Treponema sp.]